MITAPNLVKSYFDEQRRAAAAFVAAVESVAYDIACCNPELDENDIENSLEDHFYGDPVPWRVPRSVFCDAAITAIEWNGGAA